jgi:hypothetical protein
VRGDDAAERHEDKKLIVGWVCWRRCARMSSHGASSMSLVSCVSCAGSLMLSTCDVEIDIDPLWRWRSTASMTGLIERLST